MRLSHIMMDFETLGVIADAVILSIGAVKFDLDTGQIEDGGFYASISVDSNLAVGRRIQESTLVWWMGQDKAAQGVFSEPKMPLSAALEEFHAWFDPSMHSKYNVWSNGASFDIPMICHAFETHSMERPWQFWNERCYREFKRQPAAALAEKITNPGKHNALIDAHTQALQAIAIQRVLNGKAKQKVPA
jgi:hypothetical protein